MSSLSSHLLPPLSGVHMQECVCVWCGGGRPTNAAVLCFLEVPLSNKGENRGEPGTDEIGSGEGAHATLLSWVL